MSPRTRLAAKIVRETVSVAVFAVVIWLLFAWLFVPDFDLSFWRVLAGSAVGHLIFHTEDWYFVATGRRTPEVDA